MLTTIRRYPYTTGFLTAWTILWVAFGAGCICRDPGGSISFGDFAISDSQPLTVACDTSVDVP